MAKFRKKPIEIEAWPVIFLLRAFEHDWKVLPGVVVDAYDAGILVAITRTDLTIKTLEGDMIARADDMLIRGVKGEFYPCRADIFTATYELVEDN